MTHPAKIALHALLVREATSAKTRAVAEWSNPKLARDLAGAIKKHKDRELLLSQTYALAMEMHAVNAAEPAMFYLAVVAIVVGDEILAGEAMSGAIDAASVAARLGKHVTRESIGPKDALGPRSGGVGVRSGPKRR